MLDGTTPLAKSPKGKAKALKKKGGTVSKVTAKEPSAVTAATTKTLKAKAAGKTAVGKSLFYACYLLSSLAPSSANSIYIGSTPNPIKRIRQHNGDIVGGAKKTVKRRPWEMVIVVHGFPSRLAALQFEWAWQHPHKSRHFKTALTTNASLLGSSSTVSAAAAPKTKGDLRLFTGKHSERFLPAKLKALKVMFHLDHYKRWPLHLHFTSGDVMKKFYDGDNEEPAVVSLKKKSKIEEMQRPPPLPRHVGVTYGALSTLKELIKAIPTAEDESGGLGSSQGNTDIIRRKRRLECSICLEDINPIAKLQPRSYLSCITEDCSMVSHLVCLSAHFLKDQEEAGGLSGQLIPVGGRCVLCKKELKWGNLIESMKKRQQHQLLQAACLESSDEDVWEVGDDDDVFYDAEGPSSNENSSEEDLSEYDDEVDEAEEEEQKELVFETVTMTKKPMPGFKRDSVPAPVPAIKAGKNDQEKKTQTLGDIEKILISSSDEDSVVRRLKRQMSRSLSTIELN